MNIQSISAGLLCLGLTLSAHADMHPGPLPEEATRIENITEADLIGTWGFEEDIPYAKVINYSDIRADHTGTDDTLVTAQTGETVKVLQTFTWAYDPDTQIFSQEVEELKQSVNGAPFEQLPVEHKQLNLSMWLVDGERVLGLGEEYGDTLYYTEVIEKHIPDTVEATYIESAK